MYHRQASLKLRVITVEEVFCRTRVLSGAAVHHSYKLPLFDHGPDHVLVYIAASLVVAATGLFLACITKNLCQDPCVRSVARHST